MGKVFYVEPKPGTEASLSIDKAAGTITSRFTASTDVGYSYTLRPLGRRQDRLRLGDDQGRFPFCFFMNGACYRGAGVVCNGQPVQLLPLDALSPSQKLLKELKGPVRD